MSCGIDKVPDIIVKKAGVGIVLFLIVLFKRCLNIGYFPLAGKRHKWYQWTLPTAPNQYSTAYSRIEPFGIPQGSRLGPVLHNLFVSAILGLTEGRLLLMYADYNASAAATKVAIANDLQQRT